MEATGADGAAARMPAAGGDVAAGGFADDAACMRALRLRDAGALEVLYDRHRRSVFGLALYILRQPALAEEVTQEVFLALWRRAETYEPVRGSVPQWLQATTRHRAVDTLRKQRVRPQTTSLSASHELADAADTWSAVVRSLTAVEVRTAVAGLPPYQQECIVLAFFGGYSYPEVAARLQIPLGTVKSRIRIGLGVLRRRLAVTQPSPAPGFAALRPLELSGSLTSG